MNITAIYQYPVSGHAKAIRDEVKYSAKRATARTLLKAIRATDCKTMFYNPVIVIGGARVPRFEICYMLEGARDLDTVAHVLEKIKKGYRIAEFKNI